MRKKQKYSAEASMTNQLRGKNIVRGQTPKNKRLLPASRRLGNSLVLLSVFDL